MKKVFFITTLIISLIFISSCNVSNGKKDRSKFGGKAKNHQVELGTIVIKLEETGEIQPIREIEQKSQVSGELVKFHIEEGDFVNKGDTILLLSEIKHDYFDPQLLDRTQRQIEKKVIVNLKKIRLELLKKVENIKKIINYKN